MNDQSYIKLDNIITKAIEYANKFAAEAPEGFEKVAFQTALEHFLTQNEMSVNVKSKNIKKQSQISKSPPQEYLNKLLESDYDWSTTNIRNLPPLGQYLKILKIAKTEFQIDTLSSEDIRKTLYEKFRINKTVNTIGMSLMETLGKYVGRNKRGNEYHYNLTLGGEAQLQKLEEKLGEKHA